MIKNCRKWVISKILLIEYIFEFVHKQFYDQARDTFKNSVVKERTKMSLSKVSQGKKTTNNIFEDVIRWICHGYNCVGPLGPILSDKDLS